jgi:uncharacterized protein (DUF1330 family)
MNKKQILFALTTGVAFATAGLSYLHAAAVASKAYVIAEITVTDAEAYKRYAVLVPPIATKFGGKFLVRGGQTVAVEGEPPAARIVVIEFDSLVAARAFEESQDYQAIAPLRRQAARSRVFLAEGVAAQ